MSTAPLSPVRHDDAVGLDIYVGPLTRYVAGDWLTIVQQAARDNGMQVHVVRAGPEPEGGPPDADEAHQAVLAWRQSVLPGADWPEGSELPYWTDKPDWDGYGGVVLLAAYDEQPEAPRTKRVGLVRKRDVPDTARDFGSAPAYEAAQQSPKRYPSLLGGAEWWVPVADRPATFEADLPNGNDVLMSTVGQLQSELRTLNDRTLRMSEAELQEARRKPARPDAPLEDVGRFGLAVLLDLCERAVAERQPLLMDY
jgi:hypothetical protein